MQIIQSIDELAELKKDNIGLLVYFSHDQCNVCKVLKPKIEEVFKSDFPQIGTYYCNTVLFPEIAAQNNVFAVPTILIFFEGQETFRFSRNMSIQQVIDTVERPYKILFD